MTTATFAEPAVGTSNTTLAEPMETDDALYEVVYGQRVEMPPMSIRAVMITTRISSAINAFAKPKELGEAFTELLVHLPLPEDEGRDRRPDVSYLCYRRSSESAALDPDANAWDVIPDLAIEVTSPSDRAEVQRKKVLEYFRAGVRSVWVVYPNLAIVDAYETPTIVRVYGRNDSLADDPVLPGFLLRLADLFAPFAPSAT
jgi:Uma2 family endonuclease